MSVSRAGGVRQFLCGTALGRVDLVRRSCGRALSGAVTVNDQTGRRAWLPDWFVHPQHVDVVVGCHIRPIQPSDAPIDFEAVMGSLDRLRSRFAMRWGWPRESMTLAEDRADLVRHAREAEANESFNYVLMNSAESAVLGCIYIDPPGNPEVEVEVDAEVTWWVVDDVSGTDLNEAVNHFVPAWIEKNWPFTRPSFDPAVG